MLVELDDVVKHFPLPRRHPFAPREKVHSVDGVSLTVHAGEVVGLVGESGSGKSTLARLVLRLIRPTAGRVVVDGDDVTQLDDARRRTLRRTAQLVFQDPHAAMDPRMTIGESLRVVLEQHRVGTGAEREERIRAALDEVGLDEGYLDRFPGACSGGQLQRVVIARALLLGPKLLVCDEPTSALDASVQAKVLNLLDELRRERDLTMILISHDLRVVRCVSDRVAVMYLGQVVEVADREDLFERSVHPYTIALLAAALHESEDVDVVAAGEPPSPIHPPAGCRFSTRCPLATERCVAEPPPLTDVGPGHQVRCHRWPEVRELLSDEVMSA